MNAISQSQPVPWRALSAADLVRALHEAGKDPNRVSRLIYRATQSWEFEILIPGEEVLFLGDFALIAVWERFSLASYDIRRAQKYRHRCAEHEACIREAEREARAEYLDLHHGRI